MDKRIIKTKATLTKALFDQLETKSINDISVTALCRSANISRRTFYIHYSSITDIFEDYQNDLSLKVYRALNTRHLTAEEMIAVFDQILMANFRGFKMLCLNADHQSLIDDLHVMLFNTLCEILSIGDDNPDARVVIEYLAIGIINSYVFWFKNPSSMDYEKLNRVNQVIIENNLRLVKNHV